MNFARTYISRPGPKSTLWPQVYAAGRMVARVYVNEAGEMKVVRDSRAPSITIELGGRRKFKLYDFMDTIVKSWTAFLRKEGVSLKPQRSRVLYGAN